MKAIDENELIKDFSTLIRLPIPDLKLSIWHKAEELKQQFKKEIDEFQKLKEIIEPGKQGKVKEKHLKRIRFELRKKKTGWTVKPAIPDEVVKHITTMDLKPGIIKMQKFKLSDGRMIDLSFEIQAKDYFTGSISIKEKATKRETKKENPKQAKADNKTEDIKTLLTYLMNHEIFFDAINEEFKTKWKPIIDMGMIKNKVIEG
jgi:hypothetical protein